MHIYTRRKIVRSRAWFIRGCTRVLMLAMLKIIIKKISMHCLHIQDCWWYLYNFILTLALLNKLSLEGTFILYCIPCLLTLHLHFRALYFIWNAKRKMSSNNFAYFSIWNNKVSIKTLCNGTDTLASNVNSSTSIT